MIQCECAVDMVMPDCPIHGDRPVVPPEVRRATDVPDPGAGVEERLRRAETRLAAAQGKRVESVRFAGQMLPPAQIVQQPFGPGGELFCLVCPNPIGHAEFYVEVRQRDQADEDSRLAVHAHCLGLLP